MQSGYLSCAFDLFNIGDLDLLRQARSRCDRLVVGVFSDDYVARTTGLAPVVPLAERMLLLTHVRGVTDVVVHEKDADGRDAGAAPADVVFAVEGVQRETDPVGEVIWLSHERDTTSAMLREALGRRGLAEAPVRAVA